MTNPPKLTGAAAIAAMLAEAGHPAALTPANDTPQPAQRPDRRPDDLRDDEVSPHPAAEGEPGTRPGDGEAIDPDAVAFCAGLDHSDTDNARRLRRHFGEDLLVLAQEGARTATYAAWTGTHWDVDYGNARALAIAQRLGGRIALEIAYLGPTPDEAKAIEAAATLTGKKPGDLSGDEKVVLDAAREAEAALKKRKARRMAHAVTSKNKGRLEAMLACLAVHIMRDPDDFNADPLALATATRTLRFDVTTRRAPNPAFADPDNSAEDVPQFIEARHARLVVRQGHDRADRITRLLPVEYDAKAACGRFAAFLERFLPDGEVRDMVQTACGLGLLGVTEQRMFFHYGAGANGKSVFMETICRVLGDLAVTLPSESFFGEAKGAGGASPDLARLYGRTFLRVQELPEGEQLREDLVKKLTGGEDISVRNLFQGYFDFATKFIGHMSGNGYPKISGTDNGIWRRMAVVHWPVTIPEAEQRPFETVVGELMAEASGILNWMIAGAIRYLEDGLVLPEAVTLATAEYRSSQDPLHGFLENCILVTGSDMDRVRSSDLYNAFCDWCAQDALRPIGAKNFGIIMRKHGEAKGFSAKREATGVTFRGVVIVNRPPARTDTGGREDYGAHLR